MKKRQGFVSNSSSSSFLLSFSKKYIFDGIDETEMLEQEIPNMFDYDNCNEMVKQLIKSGSYYISNKILKNREINTWRYIDDEYVIEEDEKWITYQIDMPDSGEGGTDIESWLRFGLNAINYESEKIKFKPGEL